MVLITVSASPVEVINRLDQSTTELNTLSGVPGTFVSARGFSDIITSHKPYYNADRQKMVLYVGEHRIKLSAGTGFIMVGEQVYQMPVHSVLQKDDIFLPAEAFFQIIRSTIMPGIVYDGDRHILDIALVSFNITGVNIDEKANGTILRIQTRKVFDERDVSTFKHDNGWFYVTVKGGIVDTTAMKRSKTRGVIRHISADQMDESVQLAFQLRSEIEGHEFYQNSDPSELVITLRTPLSKSANRIKSVKDRWRLDTIVLDAGHGGKDGGAVGKFGTKEKDITLDITKRLGMLLEKNTNIKVVYTRDEDVFIPLYKRPKIANENNGKLFVSVHANSNPNRNAKGFETYLLRPGKTDDAIEVASRENGVIRLEDRDNDPYAELSGANLIMATMAQSMFMKESENLASIIQAELDKRIDSKNRGVKQAGFYVLIGASMPNVLVECGFLSNPNEERNLKKASYRQKIAEGLYSALLSFKESREQVLAEG
ncbi:MAG: N-acetylmuramoyl-L-alanine amidase [Candidatus Marinimicrobia bacterium]|nr:N-acetylmuramoyl-L-alanine amidase [Candidatus Neomarinimicrobiota bacterium]